MDLNDFADEFQFQKEIEPIFNRRGHTSITKPFIDQMFYDHQIPYKELVTPECLENEITTINTLCDDPNYTKVTQEIRDYLINKITSDKGCLYLADGPNIWSPLNKFDTNWSAQAYVFPIFLYKYCKSKPEYHERLSQLLTEPINYDKLFHFISELLYKNPINQEILYHQFILAEPHNLEIRRRIRKTSKSGDDSEHWGKKEFIKQSWTIEYHGGDGKAFDRFGQGDFTARSISNELCCVQVKPFHESPKLVQISRISQNRGLDPNHVYYHIILDNPLKLPNGGDCFPCYNVIVLVNGADVIAFKEQNFIFKDSNGTWVENETEAFPYGLYEFIIEPFDNLITKWLLPEDGYIYERYD